MFIVLENSTKKVGLPLTVEYGVPVADKDGVHLLFAWADDDGLCGDSSTSAGLMVGSGSAYWRYSIELSDSDGVNHSSSSWAAEDGSI